MQVDIGEGFRAEPGEQFGRQARLMRQLVIVSDMGVQQHLRAVLRVEVAIAVAKSLQKSRIVDQWILSP